MRKKYLLGLVAVCLLAAGCEGESLNKPSHDSLTPCDDTCGDGFDCVEGYCMVPAYSGESCKAKDTYCFEGECVNGKCEVASSGVPCSDSEPCAKSSEVCVLGKCKAKVGLGGDCTGDELCTRGKCVAGVCKVEVQSGQACDDTHVCASGFSCNSGICKKPVGDGEDCRSSLVFCDDGTCDQGKCVSGGAGTCKDTDGDGIADEYDRCDVDTDNDGLVDCMDDDSDGDGIPDNVERGSSSCRKPADSDNDMIPDFLDDDSDGNGILDKVEGFNSDGLLADTDEDGILDSASDDNDGDGVLDLDEITAFVNPLYEKQYGPEGPRGADCYNAKKQVWGVWGYGRIKRDDRGVSSYEPCEPSADDVSCQLRMGDLVPDEIGTAEKPFDCDGDKIPDYKDSDSDGDGILDYYENRYDSDKDGYYDRYELDSDNDSLPDSSELGGEPGSRPHSSLDNAEPDYRLVDIDGDGLEDGYEVLCWVPIVCGEGEKACLGKCIDVMSDAKNCGTCRHECPENAICSEGSCVMACPDGMRELGMTCVDPSKDSVHCGENLSSCMYDQVCTNGTCESSGVDCGEQQQCWGKCTDLQSDAANCGSCGADCGKGSVCRDGACVMDCGDKTACMGVIGRRGGAYCADLATDPLNCGECGKRCATNQVCSASECQDAEVTCDGQRMACYGVCVESNSDPVNCGKCGNVCDDDQVCSMGACVKDTSKIDDYRAVDSRYVKDADEDGFGDASEYIAGDWYHQNVNKNVTGQDFICNPLYGVVSGVNASGDPVTGAFDFYFYLPYQGNLDEDKRTVEEDYLEFNPAVSRLDVIFNLDTTKSMGEEVANLKTKISSFIIPEIKKRVSESAIGVSRFDDFPTRPTQNSQYDHLPGVGLVDGGYGRADMNDKPFELVIRPETDAQAVQSKVNTISLHHGGDLPEAGYEALWQIVKGDDPSLKETHWEKFKIDNNSTAFSSGTIARTPKTDGRWGGGQFRDNSLPVVVHITDTTSHDNGTNCDTKNNNSSSTCIPYDPAYVDVDQTNTGKYPGGHYSSNVHKAYQEKGARIISIYDNATDNKLSNKTDVRQLQQLVDTSTATSALVPVCAFKIDASSWKCGDGQCCTLMDKSGNLQGVAPVDNQCVLSYGIATGTVLSDALVDGVDALVKYATSEVAVRVKGNKIANSEIDTSCFIKRVEAFETIRDASDNEIFGYVRPPQEPEASCNPVAKAATFNDAAYLNGYTNFAIGTSSKDKAGAKLNFHIVAQNDSCVKPSEQAQVFEAYIELYEPKTGMSFGERKVSIVVPGEKSVTIVN